MKTARELAHEHAGEKCGGPLDKPVNCCTACDRLTATIEARDAEHEAELEIHIKGGQEALRIVAAEADAARAEVKRLREAANALCDVADEALSTGAPMIRKWWAANEHHIRRVHEAARVALSATPVPALDVAAGYADPAACVCPFPRTECPNCDNQCMRCRLSRRKPPRDGTGAGDEGGRR